jgi:hypothetical protein
MSYSPSLAYWLKRKHHKPRSALVSGGKVTAILTAGPYYTAPAGYTYVYDVGPLVMTGWSYNGSVFTP